MNISRHVPNLISVARIIATPILVYLALLGRENPYKCLLLAALLYLTAGLSIPGNIEEPIIAALLPTWTSDVRGLCWVLEKQRLGTA
jgi:hypothetical protein